VRRLVIVALFAVVVSLGAQPPQLLLKQERDGAPATNLTGAELAALGDPFFELVLNRANHPVRLSDLENLIQPNQSERQTFVVDENIANPERGQQRRAVLAYTGTSPANHVLTTNVMLSVAFDSDQFPEDLRFIEAWGWDNRRSRYNYYKLDRTGTPDQRLTWKFRGSSIDADLFTAADRQGTCLQCHLNGAPVLKELPFPWNNWHSLASQVTYLTTAAAANSRWPVASDPRLGSRLKGAETLETDGIMPSITQFNIRRLNSLLKRSDADGNVEVTNGKATVLEGRRLLRPLFETTEINFASARQKSGLHPIPKPNIQGPTSDVTPPPSFFLNANLISGGTTADFVGLQLPKAQQINQVVRIRPAEYRELVADSQLEIAGRPGDADFAWFVPEPSHFDNDVVDRLIRRGIVTPEFVAAVLTVDLENPLFSERRASLLSLVPDLFTFEPLPPTQTATIGRHPDDLTKVVIAALEAKQPSPGSAEADFLTLLRLPNPVAELSERIDSYKERLLKALQTAGTRRAELRRLFDKLIAARLGVLADERFAVLDETGDRLLPIPNGIRPAIRGSGGQMR
jgi:hypothetical protein